MSLVDHVAHEQLLLKARHVVRRARSPPPDAVSALQLFAPSLWDFAPDVAEAVTVFSVTLVSRFCSSHLLAARLSATPAGVCERRVLARLH